MIQSHDYFYELGMLEFEIGNYEKSVDCFRKAYELSDKYKESIVESLYNCFIIPNQKEFEDNFLKLKSSQDKCSLDFIPVTETTFVIYDFKECVFRGKTSKCSILH